MTRVEHIEWCKRRAYKYLERGMNDQAVASMLYDMSTHPECNISPLMSRLGDVAAKSNKREVVSVFIESVGKGEPLLPPSKR
ncbi:MAG: hypothetical protein QOJ15_11580 [Bradyrhizobium sp.]|jgi:hypothetical protein|nr:hypothetical protein [Bradyrhizobium sp.]